MVESLKADYGQDAPGVVRNLFVVAALGLALWLSAALGWWSGVLSVPMDGEVVRFGIAPMGIGIAIGFGVMGLWMVWSSKAGKVAERERLLDRLAWRGDEQVLDLGCGRGLLLIGAAKRLTTGRATGVDIWNTEDLSGNRREATVENTRREGVESRVDIQTADMRKLPFPDGSFDVVVSRAAIHNLYRAEERAAAIREVARVLKPGGRALIDDIRHGREYAATFAASGCTDCRDVGSRAGAVLLALLTFGSLRPSTLLVRKPA
jgi:arsenite methyltransferase